MILRMIFTAVVCLNMICCTNGFCSDKNVVRFSLLNFDNAKAGKYSYLGDSLKNILMGRLSKIDGVRIVDLDIDKKESNDLSSRIFQDPQTIDLNKFKCDILGAGSLSETEHGLLLKLSFIEQGRTGQPRKLSMLAGDESEVVTMLDSLLHDIQREVLGNEGAEGQQVQESEKEKFDGFQTEHPEKAYLLGKYTPGVAEKESRFVIPRGGVAKVNFKKTVVGVAGGDFDGDGNKELAVLFRNKIVVVQNRNGRFNVLETFSFGNRYKASRIYVADIDNDGKSEIYVSGLTLAKLDSRILAWSKDAGFNVIHSKIRWYIRPVQQDGKTILIGQKGNTNVENGMIDKSLFIIENHSGNFEKKKKYHLPEKINIFDFAKADLEGDSALETVVIDNNEKLKIYDPNMKVIWASQDLYGGNNRYYGPDMNIDHVSSGIDSGFSVGDEQDREKAFMTGRIVVADMDKDGKDELFVAKNSSTAGIKWLRNIRTYSGGSVVCMGWADGALHELWNTRHQDSYIADLKVNFVGEEGRELIEVLIARDVSNGGLGISFSKRGQLSGHHFELKKASDETILPEVKE